MFIHVLVLLDFVCPRIGLRGILQETHFLFGGKPWVSCRCSLQPIPGVCGLAPSFRQAPADLASFKKVKGAEKLNESKEPRTKPRSPTKASRYAQGIWH